ncbi:MAG: sugar diacid recognition domain-containing protein [Clostridia bacterium]
MKSKVAGVKVLALEGGERMEDARHLSTVISREIAERIVENAKSTIQYNINIMNERGIVLASADPARVGSFHEVAYQLIQGELDQLETENTDDLLGTRPGINTILKYRGERIGVLGITGEPNLIRPFVSVLKLAVVTMIDFEAQQRQSMMRFSMQNMLEMGLMYGATTDTDLSKWALELKLDRSAYRIPLYVHAGEDADASLKAGVRQALLEAPGASAQDVVTQWEGSGFVIFKVVDHTDDALENYRPIIGAYLKRALSLLRAQGLHPQVFSGSFCRHLNRYHEAYKRAVWLFETRAGGDAELVFFYDHLSAWVHEHLPVQELHDIFQFFVAQCDERFIDRMVKTEEALFSSNYHFTTASQKLYVHKNTLFSWLNQYRGHYHIDPVQNAENRVFWECLCYYCSLKR